MKIESFLHKVFLFILFFMIEKFVIFEKTGVVPFMLDDTSRNERTKMSMVFYINKSKYILTFELDAKYIYSETLVVYDSIRDFTYPESSMPGANTSFTCLAK